LTRPLTRSDSAIRISAWVQPVISRIIAGNRPGTHTDLRIAESECRCARRLTAVGTRIARAPDQLSSHGPKLCPLKNDASPLPRPKLQAQSNVSSANVIHNDLRSKSVTYGRRPMGTIWQEPMPAGTTALSAWILISA
jgi:hypothetical protein